MELEGPQNRRFLRQNSMERDFRPEGENDSRSERADGSAERSADVYGTEREDARHAEERLEFLSCDPFERSEPRTDEGAG